MPLDPEYAALLTMMKDAGILDPYNGATAQEIRARMAPLEQIRRIGATMPETDASLPGPGGEVRIRIYRPGDGTLPVIVYFHGGGFVFGSLDSHSHICRELATRTRSLVVSVDYRLAPEHPFPAAIDDAYAAVQWISRNAPRFDGDGSRLAVAGDSAGANLATITTMRCRDEGGPSIRFQLLAYPGTHVRSTLPSREQNRDGYFLTAETIDWFYRNYLPRADDADHPWASPLLVADLRSLPPALVITAEYDPLRDEGEAYAKRLADAGVAARSRRYDGAIHGFLGPMTTTGRAALDEAASALREALR